MIRATMATALAAALAVPLAAGALDTAGEETPERPERTLFETLLPTIALLQSGR